MALDRLTADTDRGVVVSDFKAYHLTVVGLIGERVLRTDPMTGARYRRPNPPVCATPTIPQWTPLELKNQALPDWPP